MQQIGIRSLRADAAAMVRRAGGGERILITVNGRTVAELGPPGGTPGDVTIDELIARGLVVAPRRHDRYEPTDPVPVWRGARLDRLLRELRG